MTFDEYQNESKKTAQYPKDLALYYLGLGIAGEAGEVAEKIKKILRNDNGKITDESTELLKKELGDVLWYIAQVANELNFSMNDVADTNLKKLFDRMDRGVLKSQGDTR